MKSLKTRIENALYQPCGFRYQHSEWNPKLWNKSQSEIKDFLWDRFNTTLDEVEYYSCMVLLYHTIPNKELLIEYKDSNQYKYKHQPEFLATTRVDQNTIELNIIEPSSKMVTIIGE